MGTNFYLRCKTPREVHDAFRIGKTSAGWRPSFDVNPEAFEWYDDDDPVCDRLEIACMDDLRDAYNTGNYDIVDEYGEVYTWEEFEKRVLDFNPDGASHRGSGLHVLEDREGYEFVYYSY